MHFVLAVQWQLCGAQQKCSGRLVQEYRQALGAVVVGNGFRHHVVGAVQDAVAEEIDRIHVAASWHLARGPGRGRAMEAILTGEDVDAGLAERYGWINRALAQADLAPFVDRLARYPFAALTTTKRRIKLLTLPPLADVRTDAAMFQPLMKDPRVVARVAELGTMGIQERGDVERNLGKYVGEL